MLVLLLHVTTGAPTLSPTLYIPHCPVGKFADGLDQCSEAWPGFFASKVGSVNATRCPAGSSCGRGADAAAPCAFDTFAPLPGLAQCFNCSTGSVATRAAGGSSACEDCGSGRFTRRSANGGPSRCEDCPSGFYAATARRDEECTACSAGFFASNSAHSACAACAPGSFSANATGAVSCAACPRHHIAAAAATTSCFSCPSGRYTAMDGATACEACTPALYSDTTFTRCWGCPAGKERNLTASDVAGRQCSQCARGRFSAHASVAALTEPCAEAPPGRWVAEPGATSALPCPAGHQCAAVGSVAAEPCPAGLYAPIAGLSNCFECHVGSVTNATAGGTACTACAVGFFHPTFGASVCDRCEAGRFAESLGQTICLPAPPGRYVNTHTASETTVCPVGSDCVGPAATAPRLCPLGTYSPSTGHAQCVACRGAFSNGSYTVRTGSSKCESCEAGRFAEVAEQTSCESCEPGRFAASAAATTCDMCDGGSHAVNTGSTTCILCNTGAYLSLNISTWRATSNCSLCPMNTFQTSMGSTSCESCSNGESTRGTTGAVSCTRDALQCPPGTYLFDLVADTSCTGCPSKGVLCEENTVVVLSHFWFAPVEKKIDDTVAVFECLNDLCCSDPLPIEAAQKAVECNEGYGGVLCGACDMVKGYVRSGQGCVLCWAMRYNIVVALGMLSGLIGVLVFIIGFKNFEPKLGEYHTVIAKMIMSYCQMLMVLGIFKARGTQLFNDITQRPAEIVGGSLTSAFPIKCLLQSSLYGPFVLNMLTPILVGLLSLVILLPVWVLKVIERRTRASLPQPRVPPKQCDATQCCKKRPLTPWEASQFQLVHERLRYTAFDPIMRVQSVLVFVMFSVYPTLVKSLSSILLCTESIAGKQYLWEDLSVVCWEGTHWYYVSFGAVCGVVYLLGSPAAIIITMFRNQFQLNSPRFRGTFSFIFNGYSTDRGALVVSWEALIMIRKLAITCIAVTASDPYTQVLIALLFLVIGYGLQEHFLPYETALLNSLESMGLFMLILTQVLSILYLYIDSQARALGSKDGVFEAAVTVALVACNASVVCAMIGGLLFSVIHTCRVNRNKHSAFNEPSMEAWGKLTPFKNPRVQREEQWRYTALVDLPVLVDAKPDSERTGQQVETGTTVLVDSLIEMRIRVGCTTVRRVTFLELSGGQGWVMDRDMESKLTLPTVILAGRTIVGADQSDRLHRKVWHFRVIVDTVPVQTASLPWPYINTTGEVLVRDEVVLVDCRVERNAMTGIRGCCRRAVWTYLHLADGRGWVAEPSRLPLSDSAVHLDAEMLKLEGTGALIRSAARFAHPPVHEYRLSAVVPVFKDCEWPGTLTGELHPNHEKVLIAQRVSRHVKLYGKWSCRGAKAIVTFLELVDGRGWIVANDPLKEEEQVAHLVRVREDSIDLATGKSLLRFYCHNVGPDDIPILIEPSEHAAQCVEEQLPEHLYPGEKHTNTPRRKSLSMERLVNTTHNMMHEIRAVEAAKQAVRNAALLKRRARRDPTVLVHSSARNLEVQLQSDAVSAAEAKQALDLRRQKLSKDSFRVSAKNPSAVGGKKKGRKSRRDGNTTAGKRFRGVKSNGEGKFEATLWTSGVKTILGTFDDAIGAAECYDDAIVSKNGSAKLLNFPQRASANFFNMKQPNLALPSAPHPISGSVDSQAASIGYSQASPTLGEVAAAGRERINSQSTPSTATATVSAAVSKRSRRRSQVGSGRSKYRGVKQAGTMWEAQIFTSGQKAILGSFENEIEAARCYDAALRSRGGKKKLLNFPEEMMSDVASLVASSAVPMFGATDDDDGSDNAIAAAVSAAPKFRRHSVTDPYAGLQASASASKRMARSKFRGVKRNGTMWEAQMWVSGKKAVLGSFEDEREAACCYDDEIRAKNGSAKLLNFPKRKTTTAPAPASASASASSSSSPSVAARSRRNSTASRGKQKRSKFRGVTPVGSKFETTIWQSGTKNVIGTFDDEVAAAKCYDDAIRAKGGSAKLLNFPSRPFAVSASGGAEAEGEETAGEVEMSALPASKRRSRRPMVEADGFDITETTPVTTTRKKRTRRQALLPTPRFVKADDIVVLTHHRVHVGDKTYARLSDTTALDELHARDMGWIDLSKVELMRIQIGAGGDAYDCIKHEWVYTVAVADCPVRNEPVVKSNVFVPPPEVHASSTAPAASTENPLQALRSAQHRVEGTGTASVSEEADESKAQQRWKKLRHAAHAFHHTVTHPPPLLLGDIIVASKELAASSRLLRTTTGNAAYEVTFILAKEILRSPSEGAEPATIWMTSRSHGAKEWWYATTNPKSKQEILHFDHVVGKEEEAEKAVGGESKEKKEKEKGKDTSVEDKEDGEEDESCAPADASASADAATKSIVSPSLSRARRLRERQARKKSKSSSSSRGHGVIADAGMSDDDDGDVTASPFRTPPDSGGGSGTNADVDACKPAMLLTRHLSGQAVTVHV